jgi:hypothetical protein
VFRQCAEVDQSLARRPPHGDQGRARYESRPAGVVSRPPTQTNHPHRPTTLSQSRPQAARRRRPAALPELGNTAYPEPAGSHGAVGEWVTAVPANPQARYWIIVRNQAVSSIRIELAVQDCYA